MSQSDYQAAIEYILGFADYERTSRTAAVLDTSRIEAVLERLGSPHLAAESIHIAGTKGKGSTAAMIASVLTASGYKTGLYTSPHLHSFTERIRIGGRPIPEADFADLADRLRPDLDDFNRHAGLGELTTFEILTVLAFVHFKEAGVDFQVLETGLGGRLDATNVVHPLTCAITSISLDHTEVLGNTLPRIAAEKAGIIKTGSTVISAPQPPEVREVISNVCRQRQAELVEVGSDIVWTLRERDDSKQSFAVNGRRGSYDLTIPLLGEHQVENAAVAVGLAEALSDLGTRISAESLAAGLAQVSWPGRLQVLQRHPFLVVDGAHNVDSARRLARALPQYFRFDSAILIMGTSRDKDIAGMVEALLPVSNNVIVTRSQNPRAADVSLLAEECSRRGVRPRVIPNVGSAVDESLKEAGAGDLVCVTGSLFVVAEAIQHCAALSGHSLPE
ncbi:MAG: folylpolyglutamate synthase/dihydrofolate synthase family protein [Dehalococcoidia bacterium]|nr:folylpolyglutamate synthase/dihydrofolate synthase family protein [Dehalococcoidia bacterium]